ncbi:hypothetical protein [Catelliglobosispora koreensis]|uniref:hypothetical protein n=1 Tax=Catelliglobosispora koreensis TaxID=129052 RepID=UPI0003692972|nr:hypothetical protein [Catelliglobosispora koreensis]
MVTRAQRGAIWLLCRFLPEGFRNRQRDEWTGDLIAIGATGQWRYLFSAAWTLPALRAHAGKPGVDRPHTIVLPTPLSVITLYRVVLIGLGLPVISWLIAIPFRYYLLDIPGIFAAMAQQQYAGPFDPKDLWPMDGPFVVLIPLWVLLMMGAWAVIMSWLMVTWMGIATLIAGTARRRTGARYRVVTALIGIAVAAAAITLGNAGRELGWIPDTFRLMDEGMTAAFIGVLAIIFGFGASGLNKRRRVIAIVIGLLAIGIHAWHYTEIGQAMLNWHLD